MLLTGVEPVNVDLEEDGQNQEGYKLDKIALLHG